MKKSDVAFGVKATTKISGRVQTVTVMSFAINNEREVIVQTPAGNRIYRTVRQLKMIVNYPSCQVCGGDVVALGTCRGDCKDGVAFADQHKTRPTAAAINARCDKLIADSLERDARVCKLLGH